jgi:putative phosphoribosyl transferase
VSSPAEQIVHLTLDSVALEGTLFIPDRATGIVLFVHGSGSSRHSPRNRYVAKVLHEVGLATLLIDLLTRAEEREDDRTTRLRFDIHLLARRVAAATDWLRQNRAADHLPIGYFGASTGAAAALVAAAEHPDEVGAVVCRGGRPDLAVPVLGQVKAPTLLIVGAHDLPVIEMNRQALMHLRAEKRLDIVPGATHLFEEPGALDQVAQLARKWLLIHLKPYTER